MKSWVPAIENTKKKNVRIMSVSPSNGIAAKSADIIILSPWTLEIVFNGLNTLNVLRELNEKLSPEPSRGPTSLSTKSVSYFMAS